MRLGKILRFRFDEETVQFFKEMKKENKNVSEFVRIAVSEKRDLKCPF